jgi:opacity protein-like surface antigen
LTAAQIAYATPASAQVECIENAEGSMLCGKDAEAEKERIRVEMLARQGAKSQKDDAGARVRSGSVYDGYRRTAFVRGGTAFSGGGAEFGKNFGGSAGVGFKLGNNGFSLQTELLVLRDTETVSDPLFGTFTAKALALAGLVGLRYDLDAGAGVNPFASVGVGPGYFRATIDDGVSSVSGDDFTFVYSGRAGLAFDLSERFGFEAAYRYLDTSQSGAPGQHSVELGLNLGF